VTDSIERSLLRCATRGLRAALVRRRNRARFERQFIEFSQLPGSDRLALRWKDRLPRLGEDTRTTEFDRHYFYHPAWAARILRKVDPRLHVDIGSSLYFVAVLSAFVRTRFYDYRPAEIRIDGLESGSADLTALPFEDRSIESLSCMHVVEHIGLGRYGDRLDPNGDVVAMRELQRVLSPGGSLLLVVPIGRPLVRFNAHRIYSLEQVLAAVPELTLTEFALIPEHGPEGWISGAAAERVAAEQYGCGCFWFQRRP
jgi:SAM-dependent methyltransferase